MARSGMVLAAPRWPRPRTAAGRPADARRAAVDHPRAEDGAASRSVRVGDVEARDPLRELLPDAGGEQEHIFNLRRHLESPADGSEPVDRASSCRTSASTTWHGPKTTIRTCFARRTRSHATAKDPRRRSRSPVGAWRAEDGSLTRGAIRSAAHSRAGRHRPPDLGALDVRRPDRRHDSQLLHPHAQAEPDRALAPLRDAAHDAGDRGQRVGARRDGALRALRQHDHRQRRRLRRLPVPGVPIPRFADGMTNILSVAPPRTPQRHRRGDRRLRAPRARPAGPAAAAGAARGQARGDEAQSTPAAGVDRVARDLSRRGLARARGSVRVGPLLRARRAEGQLLDSPARSAGGRPARRRRCRARARAGPGNTGRSRKWRTSDTAGRVRRRASARAGTVDARSQSRAPARWRGATTGASWCRGFAASTTKRSRARSQEDRMPGEEEGREHSSRRAAHARIRRCARLTAHAPRQPGERAGT